jgi:predicted AlkP superfamily pyrophosphatase or phosphodiesterase
MQVRPATVQLIMLVMLLAGMRFILSGLFYTDPIDVEIGTTMLIRNSPVKFKVILIVLDAFRLDYYHRFGLMAKYVLGHPNNSRLVQMVANSPTMTAERIQAMMTGTELSQPSVLANFMSSKLQTDNIINKVNSSLLLGDDTWDKLFNFSKVITCRSFDVADIDSCDRVVSDNLLK